MALPYTGGDLLGKREDTRLDQIRSRRVKCKEPSAIADVIQFLASDASRAINGAAVPVFGKG